MPLHIIPASYDYICLGKNIPNPSEKDDREEDCDCLEEGELFKESENDKKPSANDEKGSKKKSEKDGGDPEAKVTAAGKLPEEKKHFEKFEPVEFKHASKTKKGAFTNVTQKHLKIRQPIAVSDISIYICLIDIRDGSSKPVYGGVDHLQALSSAKTGRRSCFFIN